MLVFCWFFQGRGSHPSLHSRASSPCEIFFQMNFVSHITNDIIYIYIYLFTDSILHVLYKGGREGEREREREILESNTFCYNHVFCGMYNAGLDQ